MLEKMSNQGNPFVERIQEVLSIKQSTLRLTMTFVTVLIILHIIACFWYLVATLDNLGPDSWVVRMDYENNTNAELYIACLYWA